MNYSFLNLGEEVLRDTKVPLSVEEIWSIAVQKGLTTKLGSSGKTPIRTLSARLYMDIKNSENTIFVQVSKRPAKFFIKGKTADLAIYEETMERENTQKITSFNERDLHILLSTFVNQDAHFNCYTKTIYHENSKKREKGYNKWLHPDIVGIYFPFEEYKNNTLKLLEALKENPYKLFAFEMKIDLNFSNLREYYFQAVSNSSWAHEGYLVTLNIEEDTQFIDELRRLNNAFGIGIIKLNPEHITQSEILFSAKTKEFLDWDTIDRLVNENSDFESFVNDLMEDIKIGKIKSNYDSTLKDDDETYKYVISKNIINI